MGCKSKSTSVVYLTMRVLYFHQHFNTPKGAGGSRSYEFSQQLIARGHKVTLVCGSYKDGGVKVPATDRPGINRGEIDGIDVIQLDLPYSNHDGLIKRTGIFFKFAWSCSWIALREKYDLLFATSTPLTAGIPGIVMKVFRKKPFVFEVRDLWPELPKAMGVIKNPLILLAMSGLEWSCYRQANACIGLSPGIVKGIKSRSQFSKRVELIPNGCDLQLFKPGLRKDLALPGVGDEDFVCVFTGAHGVANGLHAVLDAAKLLLQREQGAIKFAFIGDGKLKAALKERALEEKLVNCLFFDPIPKSELAKMLGSFDAGMMILDNIPAFYFGTSPNKFFDYLAAGLPVVNNYPGWLAGLIEENECGVAVEPESPEAFACALERMARDRSVLHSMGEKARELGEKEFDRSLLANLFVDCLESVYSTSQSRK